MAADPAQDTETLAMIGEDIAQLDISGKVPVSTLIVTFSILMVSLVLGYVFLTKRESKLRKELRRQRKGNEYNEKYSFFEKHEVSVTSC